VWLVYFLSTDQALCHIAARIQALLLLIAGKIVPLLVVCTTLEVPWYCKRQAEFKGAREEVTDLRLDDEDDVDGFALRSLFSWQLKGGVTVVRRAYTEICPGHIPYRLPPHREGL
jgi:hypothetical protein